MHRRIDLAAHHLALLRDLFTQYVPHAEVWAYGSRVCGHGHDTSDLDIVLRNPAHLEQASPTCSALKEALQNSALPMLVEVHDWAHLPPTFHREIERCYAVLQTPHTENPVA